MMQNAAMNGQPPPPLPGFSFPPQQFLPPPSQFPAPTMQFPSHPQQHTMAASDRIQEVMDSDREDGEVSDSEMASQAPAAKVNGRAHAEPPRSVPHMKQPQPQVEEGYNPDRPAAGQMKIREPVPKPSPQPPAPAPVDPIQRDRDQAKQFIKLLHSHNIGYKALANESLDLDQLRGLYQSLNLPSEPAPILPSKQAPVAFKPSSQTSASPAVQPVPKGPAKQSKPAPTVKTGVSVVPVVSSAPSPVDRRDYIARLQAAKLAKQAGAAKPSSPQNALPGITAPSAPVVPTTQTATTPTPRKPVTDEERARTTEMIRQRLAAIKAGKKGAKKAAKAAVNGPAPTASPAQKPEATQLQPQQAAQQGPSATTTPIHQSYTSGLPGIPGLFMQPPPSYERPTPSAPQARPAPLDSTEASTPRGSVTPYTRPLGDSPHAYHEEPMIIEVSDDESNGSDMDIDDDQAPSKSTFGPPSTANQRPGAMPDSPSQPSSAIPGSSAVSTPGPQTPTTQARENELKRKEDQLAAMRETLKKKLAEKRAKDKAAAAASSPAPQSASTEPNDSSARHQSRLAQPSQTTRLETAGSSDAMNDASELIRDVKRRRREEIASKLPSFDVELASNTNRIAQLMQEMEALKAHSEKIAADKAQLTRELENLGVDTEGMSHDEMRAKKHEIEHEMSPEPENQEPVPVSTADASTNGSAVSAIEVQQDVIEPEVAQATGKVAEHNDAAAHNSVLPGLALISQHQLDDGIAPSQVTTIDQALAAETTTPAVSQSQALPPYNRSQPGDQTTPMVDLSVSDNTQGVPRLESVATPQDEEDDFYSPAPADEPVPDQILGVQSKDQVVLDVLPVDAPSPSEEGEVEMSVSSDDEEEEYEPEEPAIIAETPNQEPQLPEAVVEEPVVSDDVSTEDEEAYEPPDVEEEMPDTQPDNATMDDGMNAPEVEMEAEVEAEAEDGAMDIASSSSEDSDSDSDSDSESDGEIAEEPLHDETISAGQTESNLTNVADDLAPELQPETATEPVRPPPASKPS
jgi:hypothetical protein